MDNIKIGKLISKLRKQKGLTQQELADMVGIGNQAVSKWERGITIPDISIINELSKILEISSDELLKGELDSSPHTVTTSKVNKTNKGITKKLLIFISLIIILVISYLTIITYLNNKTYKYDLISMSKEYNIDGYIKLYKDNLTLVIDELDFTDKDFLNTEILNYDYKIMIGDELIYGYANSNELKLIEYNSNIVTFLEDFKVNYNVDINIKNKIKDNMVIYISFQTQDNNVIIKELNIKLK